jgi:GntR family transcriptional repressor for pyruvate dehydrogenase complex
MLIITPEIITKFEKYHVCDAGLSQRGIADHTAIYNAIKGKDAQLAKQKMKEHFTELYRYCYNIE